MMSTVEIHSLIQKEILNRIPDQGAADALREILFVDNSIDWNKAYNSMVKHMPELNI